MNIWLLKIGEPIPIKSDNKSEDRLHRIGILASMLADRGHQVTWWSSTFDHIRKRHHYKKECVLEIYSNYHLHLLHGQAYKRNASFERLINHKQIANNFVRASARETPPDIILSCLPTLELCEAAVNYARSKDIPIIIDIRDLWPDVYLNLVPKKLAPLAKLFLYKSFRSVRRICKQATALVAVSEKYLNQGLTYGDRRKTALDMVFPLGYPIIQLAPHESANEKEELQNIGVDENKIICCFIGTFGRSYDLGPVIEVAKYLKQKDDNRVQFVICGDGEKRNSWHAMASGLDNVIFTGWIPFKKLVALMQMAKIGLAAYADNASQGLPNKIFEYLAGELAIVSSLQGETKQFLQEYKCGITYEPSNANNLLMMLTMLIDSPDKIVMMQVNGKRVFHERFSSDYVYSKMIQHVEMMNRRHSTNIMT